MKTITAALFMLFSALIFCCDIEILASIPDPAKGATVDLTINIYYEHRHCVLDPRETLIKVSELKILEESDWKLLGRLGISKKIKVRVGDPAASIEVVRDCSKKGESRGVLVFNSESSGK